jgi:acyl carrier protein
VKSIEDFLVLIRDGLGLPVTAEDATRALDEVPGWDSVHVLWLLTTLERESGMQISLPALLEASSLEEIYLAAAGK